MRTLGLSCTLRGGAGCRTMPRPERASCRTAGDAMGTTRSLGTAARGSLRRPTWRSGSWCSQEPCCCSGRDVATPVRRCERGTRWSIASSARSRVRPVETVGWTSRSSGTSACSGSASVQRGRRRSDSRGTWSARSTDRTNRIQIRTANSRAGFNLSGANSKPCRRADDTREVTMLKIDKALKSSVVLLHGEEEALRRRALADLLAAAGVGPDDFDLATIVADASPVAEWIASASTSPFLAERRVVVVRNVLRIDPRLVSSEKANRPARDRFVADLKSLPASGLLVLVADEESGSDDRLRRLGSARTALAKIVEEAGGTSAEFKADPKAAKTVIGSELTRLNRRMSPAAMDALLAMTGGSASRAMEEIEKLALY
ncbi:hypothetical protein EON77_02890, partial [bacterium]